MKKKSTNTSTELRSSLDFTKSWTDHVTVFLIELLGSMRFLAFCGFFFRHLDTVERTSVFRNKIL